MSRHPSVLIVRAHESFRRIHTFTVQRRAFNSFLSGSAGTLGVAGQSVCELDGGQDGNEAEGVYMVSKLFNVSMKKEQTGFPPAESIALDSLP